VTCRSPHDRIGKWEDRSSKNAHACTIISDTRSVSGSWCQRGHKPAQMQHDITEKEQINPDVSWSCCQLISTRLVIAIDKIGHLCSMRFAERTCQRGSHSADSSTLDSACWSFSCCTYSSLQKLLLSTLCCCCARFQLAVFQ